MNLLSISGVKKNLRTYIIGNVLISLFICFFTTPYMGLATFSYLILCTGLALRLDRQWHVRLMTSGISIDLLLVLILQIKRNAIKTAVGFTLNPFQQAHIYFSLAATLLYFPVLVLGWKLWRKKIKGNRFRMTHLSLGILSFILRSLGFFLMFSLIKHVS